MKTIFEHTKSLLVVALLTAVLFFGLFYLLSYLSDVSSDVLSARKSAEISDIFKQEGERMLAEAREVAALEDVQGAIEAGDADILAPILAEEMEKRGVNVLQAVNEDGIVIYRAHAPGRSGDDVFSTTEWGRKTRDGEEVITFGEGRTQSFVLLAAHPIVENGEVKGAVFAGQSFTNEFVSAFRDEHLAEDMHLIFYGSTNGITGSSFGTEEERRLINTHMNIGSDFIQGRKNKEHVILSNTAYVLDRVELAGLEGTDVGGIIVLGAVNTFLWSLIIAFLVALFFAAIFYGIEVKRSKEKFFKRHVLGSVLVFLAVFVLAFLGSQYKQYSRAVKIDGSPFTIYNSTLNLSPAYDIYEVGKQQRIDVELESGGEAINVVGAYIRFNPDIVRVDSIITTNSFCDQNLFIEKIIDNASGEVRVSCGLPTPGLPAETKSEVFELLVTPVQEGYFTLAFSDETAVLANDGLGTDVLRFAENGGYQAITLGSVEGNTPPRIPVFSSTHPNREREYNKRSVEFSWADFSAYEYIYEFDQNEDTVPTGEKIAESNNISFTVPGDGTYWMHLAARSIEVTGPLSHYPVRVDTTPPNAPIIRASSQSVRVGEVVRFEFATEDTDELQPNFYLKIDNGTFIPTTSNVFIPFGTAGTHRVTVRVFDTAGNFSDSAVDITVQGNRFWDRFFYINFGNFFR